MKIPNVIYDLRVSPITFDFCSYLASAFILVKSNGYELFDLTIIATGFRNLTPRERAYSLNERYWRLDNLISPVGKLCPAVRNFEIIKGAGENKRFGELRIPANFNFNSPMTVDYSPRLTGKLYRETGVKPQIFAPSSEALAIVGRQFGGVKISRMYTLSPRVADFDGSRNSQLDDWWALHQRLKERGHSVLILPDQDDFLGARLLWRYPWKIYEPAALSLDLRLAAMSLAYNNLISSGGNGAVPVYSNVPYVMCSVLQEASHVANKAYFQNHCGISVNDQYPWALPSQKLDWGDFDPDRICRDYIF